MTVKELIDELKMTKDKNAEIKVWGTIDDDGSGTISVGDSEFIEINTRNDRAL